MLYVHYVYSHTYHVAATTTLKQVIIKSAAMCTRRSIQCAPEPCFYNLKIGSSLQGIPQLHFQHFN